MPRLKIPPEAALRGSVLFCLLGYYFITSEPSSVSVNSYWGNAIPQIRPLLDSILPYTFLVGMIVIVAFSSFRPYAAILIGSAPQVLYMALSAGWWFARYPDLNIAALVTHMSVTLFIYLIAWRELADDTPKIVTGKPPSC